MNLKSRFKILAVALSATFLFACGGGGGSAVPTTTVSGVAQAGIFNGATVKIYGYDSTNALVQLPTSPAVVTTDNKGQYQANIGSYSGAVLVKVFGTYHDEASGTNITVPEVNALQAALPSVTGSVSVPVTPLTDLSVREALKAGSIKDNILSTNAAVSALFGVDIVKVLPAAPDAVTLASNSINSDQKKYTILLATLSQYVYTAAKTASGSATPTPADLATALVNSLVSLNDNITVSGSSAVLTPAAAFTLQQAAAGTATNVNTQALITAAGSVGSGVLANLATIGNPGSGSTIMAFRISTAGSYSGLISGIQMTIALPAGVTMRTDATSGIGASVSASGLWTGSFVNGSIKSGVLTLGLINANGLGLGEFATIYCDVPVGSQITAASFTPTLVKVVEPINGDPISLSLVNPVMSPF
jgi:hypothetical protein